MSEVTLHMYIPFTCHLATLDTPPGAFSTEQAQDARTPRQRCRGTSLVRNCPPPRTIVGPQGQAYCRVPLYRTHPTHSTQETLLHAWRPCL